MSKNYEGMKLIAVFDIPESNILTHTLPIEDMLKTNYDNQNELYVSFRKKVPEGRYGLAISKDASGEHPLTIIDTQILDRGTN